MISYHIILYIIISQLPSFCVWRCSRAKSRCWNEDFVPREAYSVPEGERYFIHPQSSFAGSLLLDGQRLSYHSCINQRHWRTVRERKSRCTRPARNWKRTFRGQHVGHAICKTQAATIFCSRSGGAEICSACAGPHCSQTLCGTFCHLMCSKSKGSIAPTLWRARH